MIAYFLLVHRYPEQFKRMFRAIYVPGNHYLVHVDKSSGAALAKDIAGFLAPFQGAAILPSRRALWGGYSLVDAELRGMAQLLKMDANWSYFINLSGQDFPLKSQAYIRDFFKAHIDTQFIRHADQALVRPDTMNRISHRFVELFHRIFATRIPRRFPSGATPYIGTQWKAVSRRFVEHACHNQASERFKRFYKQSFIADEGFFQTVMMNGFARGAVVNDDLRTIDWIPDGDVKLRPRTFGINDALRLTLSPDLFARKFDATEDDAILAVLEKHLVSPAGSVYRSFVPPAPVSLPDAANRREPDIESVAT